MAFIQALRRHQVSPYYAIISTHPVALEAMSEQIILILTSEHSGDARTGRPRTVESMWDGEA
jgi:hypothetical protein